MTWLEKTNPSLFWTPVKTLNYFPQSLSSQVAGVKGKGLGPAHPFQQCDLRPLSSQSFRFLQNRDIKLAALWSSGGFKQVTLAKPQAHCLGQLQDLCTFFLFLPPPHFTAPCLGICEGTKISKTMRKCLLLLKPVSPVQTTFGQGHSRVLTKSPEILSLKQCAHMKGWWVSGSKLTSQSKCSLCSKTPE